MKDQLRLVMLTDELPPLGRPVYIMEDGVHVYVGEYDGCGDPVFVFVTGLREWSFDEGYWFKEVKEGYGKDENSI